MKKKRAPSSVDGFIPRRPGSELGERHILNSAYSTPPRKELKSEDDLTSDFSLGQARPGMPLGRVELDKPVSFRTSNNDLNESLNNLDDIDSQNTPPRERHISRKEKRRIKKENRTKKQRIWRRIRRTLVLIIILAVIGGGGYIFYKANWVSGNIFQGSILDILTQHQPLKVDTNGRSNFLILGTSEDDPGHEAGYLTDSMLILSIDQKEKNAYTFSIPRDLYVNYDMPCLSGYKGKINVYFSCSNKGTDAASEQDRLEKTQKFIGDIVGLDIQYGVHVNYTVMRDVINAIGGSIEVTIDSRNPNGVMDSNFDWKCGASYYQRLKNCPPDGHYIQYPNGKVTLDAEHALYLAQARGDSAPTYGFEQSNFDRERNQQMILVAIRDKAMSAGTLTNIGAVTAIIDALGNNLHTNIQTKEVRTIMDLAREIPAQSIKSLDFYSDDNRLFTTGVVGSAGSSVYPSAGMFDYTELQNYIKEKLNSDPVISEAANVTVLNGSDVSGLGQSLALDLEAKSFKVNNVDNAPEGTYDPVEIYQISSDKPATANKLKQIYGVDIKTDAPPAEPIEGTDFVIIISSQSVVGGVVQ